MIVVGTYETKKGIVALPETDLLYHTAILGQSGSGKSYFLARLLEEIVLRTKARILILDPNGDFNHFYAPRERAFWHCDPFGNALKALDGSVRSTLPSFDSREAFVENWTKRQIQFVTAGKMDWKPVRQNAPAAPLLLHWKWLRSEQDFLLDIDPIKYPKIYQGKHTCIHYVDANKPDYPQGYTLEDLEEVARQFASRELAIGAFPEALTLSEEDWLAVRLQFRQLRKRFYKLWYDSPLRGIQKVPSDLINYIYNGFRRYNPWQACVVGLAGLDVDHMLLAANGALYQCTFSAIEAWRRARQQQSKELQAILDDDGEMGSAETTDDQAQVLLANTNSELEGFDGRDEDWCDTRVPTFVVIDEAHNFAPEEPISTLQARVSDKIATIAAEGRKYGLFLILATQRPQKLRKGLLSECENSAILRIQSKIERVFAAEALGIPPETVEHVSNYQTGTALLHGRWVPSTVSINSAPARTMLGGGGIDASFWSTRV